MKALLFVDRIIARIAGWLLVLVLSAMIVMSFGQVALRNFFGTSIEWGDILLRHLVLWLGFLGATIATGDDRHIKVDFLTKFIPAKPQKILSILTSLFAGVICYFLLNAAISFIQIGIDPDSTLILNLPTWYFVVIIPVGYGLMAFRFVVVALKRTVEIIRGDWTISQKVDPSLTEKASV
jgi:C4-dicarboxylate transporter DctQ subunit